MTTTVKLRAEYREDSPWVATARPRLSWVVETSEPGWVQTAAEVLLDDSRSAVLDGADHVLVAWPFDDLLPRQEVTVRVRVRDGEGNWLESGPCVIRFGALDVDEWRAAFVALAEPDAAAQPFIARHRIHISGELVCATMYWSALGVATFRVDGRVVDDAVLSPGWTSYPHRVLHETVDVTALLSAGDHTLGFEVFGGWYTESYGFADEAERVYGDQPSVAAQLHLRYADGTEEVISSDGEWEASGAGAFITSGIYDGEKIDLRRAEDWWLTTAPRWPAAVVGAQQPVPVARFSEPVRRIAEREVLEVITTPSGRTVLDFGQNIVGRLRFSVSGPAGTEVVIRHAEVLEDGEIATRPLRRAAATDTFILSGSERDVFEPSGTFHGFRYAEVSGWPGILDPAAIRAVVLHSDMRRTGWLTTSHPLLQRLHENVVWSMRGNFLALPTDCPQRDERLGWTGDAQIFAPTASTLFDCNAFLANWLTDLRLDQDSSGGVVPTIVPNVFGFAWPAAGWGDAATIVPSVLEERYADEGVLVDSIASMRAWVDKEIEAAGGVGLWETTLQFGDWLDPSAPPDMAGASKVAPGIVATSYLCRSLDLLAVAAERGGHSGGAQRASAQAAQVREAFRSAYLTADGRMLSDAPTAYALALQFDLITDDDVRRALASRLAHVVKRDAFHISTGFIGTPLVLDALTDHGYDREASALLLQTRAPSWLYPVTMGATTIWERWDSMLPDGSINPGEMTSFNHYALGAVVDWMYRRLAGITPEEPGYAGIRFAPVALAGLDDIEAEVDTVSGRIRGGWRRRGAQIEWSLTVPAHARAVVEIPGVERQEVGTGSYSWVTDDERPVPVAASTLWSPVSAVVDDPAAYAAVMSVLDEHDPALADNVRRRTDWTLQTPLAAALFSVPGPVVAQIAASLEKISHAEDPVMRE
ncbi:alpha-L-rhamnosidase [Microbacterium aerolatum]|uniref:alpha-L-rhamnosidase n=1 Tax=Microbacterium aerolatum TaxID=153731 RepID=A0A511AJB2_9MICO|nr:alpha-L-rhamnosidase [Microbacterium aerolatum]GEK87423.1 alpha-L-rhamnosidase [Microbacterium aerolatum]GGB33439.1 alpha-L-rhamnosidase [Microbacterium aerolatum]